MGRKEQRSRGREIKRGDEWEDEGRVKKKGKRRERDGNN